MKKKQKVDCLIAVIFMMIAVLYLLFPLYHISNLKQINIIMFSIMSVVSLGQFLINYKTKDYTGLFNFFACLVFVIFMIVFDVSKPKILSTCILLWVALEAFIKFNKSDYYNDRRDRMWKISIIMLTTFIISGILTSINLKYSEEVRVVVMGFFLFINSILELVDPIVKYLITRS